MTKEQLMPFCDDANSIRAYKTGQPWTFESYTYATDGRMIVRVPAMVGIPDNPNAPKEPEGLLWQHDLPDNRFTPLTNNIPPVVYHKCEDCNGCGGFICKEQQWVPALLTKENRFEWNECDGCENGRVRKTAIIELGHRIFSNWVLVKIAALANPRIAISAGTESQPMPFRFDGGSGLVMPMRRSPEQVTTKLA